MVKRISIILGLLLVLLLAALAMIPLLVNPNDYKDKIADLARAATGRELTIVDDMKLSLFPWIGIEFGRVEFANAPGFGDQPFARITAANVKVRLLPLLQRKIEIDTVALAGLELSLETVADGRTNWDDLVARAAADADNDAAPPPPAGDQAALALPAALTIGGLDVRDAALHWRDAAGGTEFDVTKLRLGSGRIEPGKSVDLQLGFDLYSIQPALAGRLDLSTRITADLARQRLQAGNLALNTSLAGEDIPVGQVDLTLKGNLDADLAGKIYEVDKLLLRTVLAGAQIPGGRLALDFEGGVSADLPRQSLRLPDFSLKSPGLTARGTLQVTQLLESPLAAGRLQAAEFNPRDLMKTLGMTVPQTADAAVLTRAGLELDFEAAGDRAAAKTLRLQLDDSTLTGTASVRNFTAPAVAFDLVLDHIDVDRYLPPPVSEPVAATPGAAAPAALQLPLDTLRGLNLDGGFKASQLRIQGLTLTDIRFKLRAKDGLIALTPLNADLYGGRYAGNIRLDARGEAPAFSLNESLTGVRSEPLLKDLLDNDTFSGIADFTIEAKASGDTEDALLRSLNGNARFSFRDGSVKGFNAAQMIREAKARIEGRPPPPAVATQTDFTELGGSVRFDKGVARNDDLHASSPYLRIAGSGQADLVKQQLDYRLRVKLVGTEIGQGGEQAGDLKGVDIPLRISGAFAAPAIQLDSAVIGEALSRKAKAAVKEKAEEKKQELKQELEDKLKGKLKGLVR